MIFGSLRRSTCQDATLLHLLVCPLYLHGTPSREGSESEDDCFAVRVGISWERIQTYSHEKRVNGVDDWFCAQLVYDENRLDLFGICAILINELAAARLGRCVRSGRT
jgi:hypothetical protein